MEVKELRDIIKVIHDSGDCGQALSDVLEMANKICEQPSELEIVQKALSGSYASICEDGRWFVEKNYDGDPIAKGQGMQSLLTWAKQQIGVE